MSTTRKIIYITIALILVVLIVLIILQSFKKQAVPPQQTTNPAPLPSSPSTSGNKQSFSTPLQGQAVDTFVTQVTSPKQLSSGDENLRNAFISQADTDTHIIHQTNSYTFLYAPDADLFQVEITAANVSEAEQEAVSWILGQGLTQQGLCNLPVIFFRDPKAFNQSETTGLEIYPQPDFCQK